MGTSKVPRHWWERLDLDETTAERVAATASEFPADLAGRARGNPDDFRRVFGEAGCANLIRAITAHLQANRGDTEYSDLLKAVEEVTGKREPKQHPPVITRGFGFVDPAPRAPVQPQVAPPLPRLGADPVFLPAPKPPGNKPADQN